MNRGLVIDWECADRIVLASLKDQLRTHQDQVRGKEERGEWMHEEDYANSKLKYIPALELLIDYYGG